MARSVEEATEVAERIGFPVVMKIVSPDIIHKSDVGGVRVNLTDRQEVEDAYDLMMLRIPQRVEGARIDGVYVETMAPKGREVILGMTRDPQFGPMLMFGLGGIFVEVMKDVTFHLAPVTADEALQMLQGHAVLRPAPRRPRRSSGRPGGHRPRDPEDEPTGHGLPPDRGARHQPLHRGQPRRGAGGGRRPDHPLGGRAFAGGSGAMNRHRVVYDLDWEDRYAASVATAEEAVERLKPGQRIFVGTGAAQPHRLVCALLDRSTELPDVQIIQLLTLGHGPYPYAELRRHYSVNAFFVAVNLPEFTREGLRDYTPLFVSALPRLFDSSAVPLDVALIQVTPPDERGVVSLGMSVDIVKSAAANAGLVIAQVNPNQPWTEGDSFVDIDDIDVLVPASEPLTEIAAAPLRRGHPPDRRVRRRARRGRLAPSRSASGAPPRRRSTSCARRRTWACTPRCSSTASST